MQKSILIINNMRDKNKKLLALVVAGGQGIRAGFRKQYAMLGDEPVLVRSCKAMEKSEMIAAIAVSVPEEDIFFVEKMLKTYGVSKITAVIAGGAERQDTVRLALEKFSGQFDFILIHDAARPLVDRVTVDNVIKRAFADSAAIVAVPSKDTMKLVEAGSGIILTTPPRDTVYLAQTPQVFSYELIQKAHALASAKGWVITDDASAAEMAGINVIVVEGSYTNIKLTTKEDFIIAEAILKAAETI